MGFFNIKMLSDQYRNFHYEDMTAIPNWKDGPMRFDIFMKSFWEILGPYIIESISMLAPCVVLTFLWPQSNPLSWG